MKTDLVDLVKVTPVSKQLERQTFSPTRGVNNAESSHNQQQSGQTFNHALENHQNSQKETTFQTQSVAVKKTEPVKEESKLTPVKEEAHQTANVQEKAEDMAVEFSEEETVELDNITLSTAVQAMQQEIENGNIPLTSHGENETETKIDTLLSLLSKQTDLKIPKLEQYVSSMRDAGKSAQEILNTLKNALEEVTEEKGIDLKDFVLKIVLPNETAKGTEQADKKAQEKPEDNLPTDGKAPKKNQNTQPEIMSGKATEVKGTEQKVPEEIVQKTMSTDAIQETAPEKASTEDHQGKVPLTESKTNPIPLDTQVETVQSSVQDAKTMPVMSNRTDDNLLESESLHLLRDKVNTLLDQFKEGIFKSTTQEVNVKEILDNAVNNSELKIDIPEKVVEALAERMNVSKEVIVDFLSSNLIPEDKLQPFIQSFNTIDTQAFMENNEALLSQMKAFIKLHHHLDSGSKITLQTRSITVETTVIKQMILNRFNSNGFNSEFLNRKEPILFKSSQSVFSVEKLTVRFVSKTIHTETTDKGFFKNTDGEFMEKAVQTSKRFFQQTFKNSYETTSQRMSDLERFHAKASNTESQSEHLANKAGKTVTTDEKTTINTKTTETKFQTVSMNEDKEVKGTKSSFDHESTSHSGELKAGRSFTDAAVKNEQTIQVRNLEQVYQKIKDMTQLMARQQTRTELATIKLNPPELGRVSLEVVKEGNKISILMQVETKEAQEILNKNSNLLAARLVNNGFELQKVTVQMEKYEEQGNNQSNQNNENNSQDQQNENQDSNNENEYAFEEEYTFADLLKGGIEENAS